MARHIGTSRPSIWVVCTLLAGFIAATHTGPRALADSDGTGSVVGENIEAQVQFQSPSDSSTVRCEWRPALDITAGAKPGNVAISVRTSAGVTESLYLRVCPDAIDTYYWIRNDAGPRAATVAKDKVSRLVPTLIAHTAPHTDRVVVNMPMWFWISRSLWRPVSVTAYLQTPAGPVTVTTTATPKYVEYEPGDGSGTIRCTGPGTPWNKRLGDTAHSRCSHTYRSASSTMRSRTYPANVAIRWAVTWRSNLGLGGSLPSIKTALNVTVRVNELQALSR